MGRRSNRIAAIFCGSQDWKDERIIFSFLWGLYETTDIEEEKLSIVHTNDRGVGRTTARLVERLNKLTEKQLRADTIKGIEYAIAEDEFTVTKGYQRNTDMIENENPEYIFAFVPDILTSPGTQHMLELAEGRGIKSYLIQRYC